MQSSHSHLLAHSPEAIAQLQAGLAAQGAEQWSIARHHYQQGIQQDPHWAGLYVNLCATYRATQATRSAERALALALRLDPQLGIAHYYAGLLAIDRGDREMALRSLKTALAQDPELPETYPTLGEVWTEQAGLEPWLAWLRQHPLPRTIQQLAPKQQAAIAFWQGLAWDDTDPVRAEQCFRQALACDPELGNAAAQLGQLLARYNRFEEALAVTEQALIHLPEDPHLRLNHALCLLSLGRWDEGWRAYEWRRYSDQNPWVQAAGPEWNGQPLRGTLLVLTEQGLGDTLQFSRYLAWARQRCDRVVLWCPQSLVRLMETVAGVDQVFAGDDCHIPYRAHVSLLSLPRIAGTTVEQIPAPIPYLRPIAPMVNQRPLPRQTSQALAVGIVWQSGPHMKDAARKCMALDPLAIALQWPGVQLYSFQVDRSEAEADRLAAQGIVDLAPQIKDFADTAAFLAQIDLLVTVDTAICHLAGAMGKPVWTLLPYAADWRWLRDRPDTPWYPTMRLFRQSQPGSWTEPLDRVRSTLECWVRSGVEPDRSNPASRQSR